MNLVIIGGGDAGISAALRAKERDPSAQVSVLVGGTAFLTTASAACLSF